MIETRQEQEREELVSFLKERSILGLLDHTIIHGLSLSLEELNCGPGYIVFREGDKGDGLYIIKKGSVEVRKSDDEAAIAYLTAGECFGEMSIVHGAPRAATIRVPEEAIILKLSKKASVDLTAKFPKLAEELARLAQKREAGKLGFEPPGLQGNTAFFDLPTVIQAVHASRQSGKLNISPSASAPGAKLIFHKGSLCSADFKHLSGEYALFELFCNHDAADFVFERLKDDDTTVKPDPHSNFRPIERLLIDGARRCDQMPKLLDSVGGLQMTFSTATDEPDFRGIAESVREAAKQSFKLVEADLTVEEMLPMLRFDAYAIIRSLSEMLEKGMIIKLVKLLVDKPAVRNPDPKSVAKTVQLDVSQLRKQPAQLASTVYALNMVSSNLSSFVSTTTIQRCLEQALSETADSFPQLAGLKVHSTGKTLDLRSASPDLTRRSDSRKALNHLAMRFLQLIAANPDENSNET
jgi:hypothetical protein